MNIHVITIGSEILVGHTTNTNLSFIGETLADHGFSVLREVCIPDTREAIRTAVEHECRAADVVITLGGLGPTRDDMTRQVVCETLGLDSEVRPEIEEEISRYLRTRGVDVDARKVRVQAVVPEGATVFANKNGTAPGLWCPVNDTVIIMLPGPPRELEPMFVGDVVPRLEALGCPDFAQRMIQVCGIPESVVAERVETLLGAKTTLDIAYCARPGMVDVRLSGRSGDDAALGAAVERIREHFGEAALRADEDGVRGAVANLLTRRGWSVATAESCTGGGIGEHLTEQAGASEYYAGGVICYSNILKRKLLGVKAETLAECGAVSAETAGEMLDGLLQRTGADAGIAVTGIAGPGGGTPDKPVGLVFIATGVRGERSVERHVFPGTRQNVRERTIFTGLNTLRLQLIRMRSKT
ncbi:MAG: competence/damage-inducible protein A [Candidatus Pacebacteria bacterium]|nr:competence/damage-inducible protein A [Candidatus Paceibacterota bacterium]